MGCFDVADGISGITIKHGDKCGLILMQAVSSWPHTTEGGKTILKPTTSYVYNEGPMGAFKPFCLPIWGKYNDYGSLEDIKMDATVKGLEKHFCATIDQILDIIHSSDSRDIWDSYSNVQKVYGNGLEVGFQEKPSIAWLEKAGFRRFKPEELENIKDIVGDKDAWILPGTPLLRRWDKGKKEWIYMNQPQVWFEFDHEAIWSGHDEKVPLYRTHKWKNEDGHNLYGRYEMSYDHDVKDFCKSVMKNTAPGFFSRRETGIILGIKEEHWDRLIELRSLSGMFIDRQLFDAISDTQPTTSKNVRDEHHILDHVYPNKHMMPLLGFKFEKMVSGEDPTKEVTDDGLPLNERRDKTRLLVYTHEAAPEYRFAVQDCDDNMCVDLYDKDMKDLDRANGMNGERYSVSTFCARGVQRLIEVLTGGQNKGTKIPIAQLLDLPEGYFFFAKMKDFMERREKELTSLREWEKENEHIKNLPEEERKKIYDARSQEEKDRVHMMLRRSFRSGLISSDDHYRIRASVGFYSNFKYGFDFYGKQMLQQPKQFKEDTMRFDDYLSVMWSTNRSFFPSAHFGQHGEYKPQVSLFANMLKVAMKKQSKWDEESDEEASLPIPVQINGEGISVRLQNGILVVEQKQVINED